MSNIRNNPLLEAALSYGEKHLGIVPIFGILSDDRCECGNPECNAQGKHPRINKWQQNSSFDRAQIIQWWTEWPNSNIGIATGEMSGFFAVDIDGEKGMETLQQLETKNGPLPNTVESITGSGFSHYLFRMPPEVSIGNKVSLLPKIDIRGNGGQIIVAPSKHKSGNLYRWVEGKSPFDMDFAEAPEYLIRLITKSSKPKKLDLNEYEVIPEGMRNATLFRIGCSLRSKGLSSSEMFAALAQINEERCQPPYDETELKDMMERIERKYEAGTSLVRYQAEELLPLNPELAPYKIKHAPLEDRKVRPNELAMRVLSLHRIITDSKKNTYLFTGQRWEQMDDVVLEALAARVDAITQTNNNRCTEAVSFIKRYSLKQHIPWRNIKPMEIPLKSGVLNIENLTIREAIPEDYLETIIPHVWDPTAECPEFLNFLQMIFANASEPEQLIHAIFEFTGYILMQSTPYKKALVCVGPSNTGKTTFEKVLIELVGKENICHIPIERMGNSSELAPIKGKMLNVVGEIKATAVLDDAGFKQMVSIGEPVQLNEKYKVRETYTPFAKHAFFTNNLPTITDSTDAVFNRLLLIPFDNVITPDKQDPHLAEKLSKEIPGILVRAVNALRSLIERRGQFTIPECSKELIRQYKREQNPMFDFLEASFEQVSEGSIEMETVRQALYLYLPRAKSWSPKKITQLLLAADCDIRHTSVKGKQGKFLFGHRLRSEVISVLIVKGSLPITAEPSVF